MATRKLLLRVYQRIKKKLETAVVPRTLLCYIPVRDTCLEGVTNLARRRSLALTKALERNVTILHLVTL